MADRTMEELLQAPTEGYGEAIVIPEILAEIFEIKTNLLQLVQANKFHGFERDNPHTHISNFKRMTATLKYRDVPNDAIKLMLFSYSLEGAARIWYEKEPPNSILTWDDLVNKFVNQFFPPSKTTHLKNEISRFTQRFEETFSEAWDRFKDLLRACPHHGFSDLTQIDTFYNGLTEQDQDSLNAASGGNLLNKTTREALKIIENRAKVRYSRSKLNDSRVNTNSRDVVRKTDDRIDKLADQISNLVDIVNKQVIALAKAVEKNCVTCKGAYAYYECIATDSNPSSVCAATGSYNQVSPANRASHQIPPPGFAPVQNNPNRFNQNQGQGNYFNQANNFNQGNNFRGNNFHNIQGYRAQMNNASNFQNQAIKSMQNQINVLRGDFNKQEENLRRNLKDDMRSTLGSFFQNQLLTSGTLLSNIVPNPKDEMKAVTTRSGLAYEGPSIPTESPLEKVDEQNTKEILDKEHSNISGSTAQVQPPVVPISILEPDVSRTQSKTSIPYPSSFADALLLMPNFASTIKSLLTIRYSSTYDDTFVNQVDVIDIAYDDFVQDVLDFQYNPKSSSPTLVSDDSISESDSSKGPIVKSSSPPLTPFGESDFFSEEIENFLKDDSILTEIKTFVFDLEGDILFIEKLLNEDPCQLPPMDLKLAEEPKEKSSVEEPPELELKKLPSLLKEALINVLKSYKYAITWKISDIKGIVSRFCTHKILMEDDYKPAVHSQRRVNLKIHDVIKKEVIKLLDAGMIYPISDSPWVSPIHCVPKKGGMTVAANENNELIPTRPVTGWRMLERLAGNEFYCFLDGFSGYFQILIDPQDLEKTTFTCPYRTFAYRRNPFSLCNALGTFQRCMMSIFHDMIEKTMEVFMDDFLVFGDSFSSCLTNLDKMLNRCEETNLVLNWEKCHFMCRKGIVLGHIISKSGIEVNRAKVDVIAKLPHPTTVKGVRSFLGHAVNTLKKKLTEAPILVVPDWNLPFELMCDASDYAIGVVLGQHKSKHFQPIHYASKTMTEAQIHCTTTEKEMLAVVYAFEKFWPYLVLYKSIVYTDHSALKYLLNKQDAKPR
nr:reverse transcriptase domain-containing protein [Tanacetum cinerariifolium]